MATKTPWTINSIRNSIQSEDTEANAGRVIAVFYGPDAEENMRRVAVSVGALEHVAIEKLESDSEIYAKKDQQNYALRATNADLLLALKLCLSVLSGEETSKDSLAVALENAKQAIINATDSVNQVHKDKDAIIVIGEQKWHEPSPGCLTIEDINRAIESAVDRFKGSEA